MRRENILFIILVLTSTLGQVSSDLYLPSLPAIAKNLDVSFQAVKLTISIYIPITPQDANNGECRI
jgi:Ca2+/Na+ antiporter